MNNQTKKFTSFTLGQIQEYEGRVATDVMM